MLIAADLTVDPPEDYVSIIVEGQEDKVLLMTLAQNLGKAVGGEPIFFAYERGAPPLSNALALSFKLKGGVMPRDGRTLPTNILLEAFAPYASHLQVLYQIEGPFAYATDWQMTNKDVSFKITKVFESPQGTTPPFVMYDTDARIINPALTSASVSDYLASQHGKKNPRKGTLFLLLGLAIVIGVSGGMLIAQMLKQWKAQESVRTAMPPGGVHRHERQRDDA
ncbi:MAG: hypothetical protein ACYDCO_16560 [Armatimonadota bacterium]